MIKKLLRHKMIVILFSLIVGMVVLYFLNQIKPPFEVKSTNPENGATKIMDNQNLEISFDQPLNPKQQAKISIIISPTLAYNLNWRDNQVLEINPQQTLTANQQYQVNLRYGFKSMQDFSFTTNAFSSKELQKQITEQIKSDMDYAAARQKIDQDYPWLKHLPIETEDYSVVYDFDLATLRLQFKNPTPTQNVRNVIINQALKKLSDLGISIARDSLYIIDYQSL